MAIATTLTNAVVVKVSKVHFVLIACHYLVARTVTVVLAFHSLANAETVTLANIATSENLQKMPVLKLVPTNRSTWLLAQTKANASVSRYT